MKHRFLISFLLLLLCFCMTDLYSQNINMQPGIIGITDETGYFYDQGGLTNDYPATTEGSIQLTLTSNIQYNYGTVPAPNWVFSSLQFNFTQFALGVGDTLFIYDGSTTAAPLIGAYNSVNNPGVIISTGRSLTFVFYSDGIADLNGLNMGWRAFYGTFFHLPRPYFLNSNNFGDMMECNAILYDSGGPTGNFASGENNTIVFRSNIGTHIKAERISFDVGSSVLEIFDGNLNDDPNARRIGYFKNGYIPPEIIISSGPTLSFRFITQGTGLGFQFDISCITEIFQQGPGESACPKIDLGPYVVNGTFVPQDTIVFDCSTPMVLLYADIKAPGLPTKDYILQSIPYDPPFAWYGNGLSPAVMTDDVWFGTVNLPNSPLFSFAFYGQNYTSLSPGANGAVSFNPHSGGSGYVFDVPIPNTSSPTYAFDVSGFYDHKNSIFGILQDTDPFYVTTSGSDIGGIWYGFQGEFPCRAFVMSFNRLPLYGNHAYPPSFQNDTTASYQIVMYEGSNIIEVHVRQRIGYSSTNGGRSLLGLLNAGGNQAVVPAGRNTGNWDALNEAWRFIPISPVDNITAIWYKNSVTPANLITNNNIDKKVLAVYPDETTTYIGKLEFPTPIGTSYILYDTLVVVVNKPAINATSAVPTVCPNEPVELTINTVNPNEEDQLASFRWYEGTTLLGTDQTIEVSPNATTTYNVIITYTNNCENSDTLSITVPELIKPVIIGDTTLCDGERSTLIVTEADGTYNWSTGATSESIIVSPSETSEYSVDVTTPIGCITKDSITVNVSVKPTAMFLPSPNHVYVENGEGPINFVNMSQDGTFYTWNFGDQHSLPSDNFSALESPIHIYTRSGKYKASLVVESEKGCIDSTHQFVTVEVPYFYYVPNSFTPNGDGINDLFFTSGEGVDPENFEMYLYNRMGNLIFKSVTPYDYWDGRTLDGTLAAAGVYVYVIITHDMEGNPKRYQGSVTLIR